MGLYKGHRYEFQRPFEAVNHRWELRASGGGIHLNVSIYKETDPSCGLEFHHDDTMRVHQWPDEAAHHLNCSLTGGRCWHEGTSLYARETIWPEVEAYLRMGNHDAVFRLLEREWERHKKQMIHILDDDF